MLASVARVVIVGGGPAGCACAVQLARAGYDVIVATKPSAAGRVGETCGPHTFRLLASAGIAPPSERLGVSVREFRSAWGRDELDTRDVRFWRADDATVIDRPAFDRWMIGAARSAGALVLEDCAVHRGIRSGRGWTLSAEQDDSPVELSAEVVVEATGRGGRSVVQPDVRRWFTDQLVCMFAPISPPAADPSTVVIEACDSGWWYSAPTPDGRRMLALFTDADLVPSASVRRSRFMQLLAATTHVSSFCADVENDLEVRTCDARTGARSLIWRDTWLSIGDAAWSLDPLSGNGVERGITDGLGAAAAIHACLETGDRSRLREHARASGAALKSALALQGAYYRMERRWAREEFWRRRLSP